MEDVDANLAMAQVGTLQQIVDRAGDQMLFTMVLLGIAATILVAIMSVRFLIVYLPDDVFGEDHVWAAYLIVGAVFCLAGAILWTRRLRSSPS